MSPSFPVLHTQRLSLVEVQSSHRLALYSMFTDKQVTEYFPVIPLHEEADAQKIIDMFRRVYAEGTGLRWLITEKGNDELIGMAGYNTYTQGGKATIVYAQQPSYWGKGYITEALQAILQYGIETLGITHIEAEVLPNNNASEKVLDKLGFAYKGLVKEGMEWAGGKYDVNVYELA